METGKLYASFIDELLAYMRTRFRPGVFVFLAAFLCVAAATGPPSFPWNYAAAAMLPSLLLLLQFRIWDDLSDRHKDAIVHPDRVLPTSRSIELYQRLVIVMAMVNIVIVAVFGMPLHVTVLVMLNVMTLAWYALLRDHLRHPLLHSHVVLLKYPAFVAILNGFIGARSTKFLGYAMFITYFAFCVYEILHDPALQRSRTSFVLLAAESAILVIAPIGLRTWLFGDTAVDDFIPYVMSALTALALGLVIVVYRHKPTCKGLHVAPACVAVFHLLMLNIRSSQ